MAGLLRRIRRQSAASTDKRFKRAHVKPSRRRSPGAKRAWFAARLIGIAMLLAYAAYQGVTLIAAAPALQIGHMIVRGQVRLSTGEVVALVEGLRGQNILAARLDVWQQRLMSSPWVESATIRRILPATVEITVTRAATDGHRTHRHDAVPCRRQGRHHRRIRADLRRHRSPDHRRARRLAARRRLDRRRGARRLRGPGHRRPGDAPDLLKQVSQLDVSNLHDAIVILDNDAALLRLGETDFAARLQQYIDLAPALRERVTAIDYVDLRFDERLYVRPAKTGRSRR